MVDGVLIAVIQFCVVAQNVKRAIIIHLLQIQKQYIGVIEIKNNHERLADVMGSNIGSIAMYVNTSFAVP
jgi:hypothetical protein